MPHAPIDRRCQLAARVREPHERTGRTRPRKYAYWRTPLRMCRRLAFVLVRFVDQPRDLRVCKLCWFREALERAGDVLEFEVIHVRGLVARSASDGDRQNARSRRSAV